MTVFDALSSLTETLLDHLRWRREWERTSSPVSYWLAAIGALGLILLLVFYGAEAWSFVKEQTDRP